jgi:hypothetical protein
VIERYLSVASLAMLVFAAVTLGGWTMLEPGTRGRSAWMAAAGLAVLAGVTVTAFHLSLRLFEQELRFRGRAHTALTKVLHDPKVLAAARCGPVTLPNHKLVPDTRWISGGSFERVWARAESLRKIDPRPKQRKGVAIYVSSRYALFKHAFTNDSDPAIIEVPPDGWRPISRSQYYTAYARC